MIRSKGTEPRWGLDTHNFFGKDLLMAGKKFFRDLREFISELEKGDELLRIKAPVSAYLEITHITDLMCKSPGGGKALLFENVEGFQYPVLTNAYGSNRRICMALGVSHLDELGERLQKLIEMPLPAGLKGHLELLPLALDVFRSFPRSHKNKPPCQEIVMEGADVNLNRLPVLHCWPQDGGPFITLPLVITKSLKTGKRNVGMYRLQVFDSRTTGMHWHVHKDGSHYFQEYKKAGKRMPVAVAIGTDPATTYAATAPLPRGVDEMLLAGFIRRKPVPLAKCLTVPLEVPAYSEFVLEGYVDPEETRPEGPFGDHTGYYSLVDDYPVFHVTAITHRKNPIYFATVVGRPPMEDCYLAKATERLFLPMLKAVFPEINDYWLPWEGVFHNITVISMEKEYPGHALKLMNGLWGQGQMSFSKALVFVDSHVDLGNPAMLIRHLLNTVDIKKDIYLSEGILDVLDHSAPNPLVGGKIGIDGTGRLKGETPRDKNVNTKNSDISSETEKIKNLTPGVTNLHVPFSDTANVAVLVNVSKTKTQRGQQIAEALLEFQIELPNIYILFDNNINLKDYSLVAWKLFNNVDPKRDIYFFGEKMVIDATKKGPEDGHLRPWPDDIVMDRQVVEKVASRARELGIEEFLP